MAVTTLTMAELAAGPHTTGDPRERARRQDHLQRAEATSERLGFDGEAARFHGQVDAAVTSAGRKARGPRAVDLMIAAVAGANRLPLFTRNPDDLTALDGLVEIVAV